MFCFAPLCSHLITTWFLWSVWINLYKKKAHASKFSISILIAFQGSKTRVRTVLEPSMGPPHLDLQGILLSMSDMITPPQRWPWGYMTHPSWGVYNPLYLGGVENQWGGGTNRTQCKNQTLHRSGAVQVKTTCPKLLYSSHPIMRNTHDENGRRHQHLLLWAHAVSVANENCVLIVPDTGRGGWGHPQP